ncbi:MAG: transcriptional regulator, TetR family [Sphingobacteriales bacterium]|nr:transcriptional regulator, TetR family [Sphingobacteriales bacterium]
MEQRIVNKARELFFQHGIKSITMDDIAKQSGVSKKTIYQYFSDKNELVNSIINTLILEHGKALVDMKQHSENAMDEVLLQVKAIINLFVNIKPSVFFELEKYFPEVDCQVKGHTNIQVLDGIIENLQRGVNEGLYRPDLNIKIISQIRLNQLTGAFNGQSFKAYGFNIADILHQLTEIYLYGIATEKGRQLMNEQLKQHI